jgi:hypothetical protein
MIAALIVAAGAVALMALVVQSLIDFLIGAINAVID